MTTKEIVATYKRLLATDSKQAEAFFNEHKDDKVFVALVELRKDVGPAFVEAGKRIRAESAARVAAFAAIMERELVLAWTQSRPEDPTPPAFFRTAAANAAPLLEQLHIETCDLSSDLHILAG